MKELYLKLPTVLKKQIIIHASVAILAIILFFVVVFCFSDMILALPCLLLSVFMIVKTAILFYNCIAGLYIAVTGVCTRIETTGLRKRIKAVTISAEEKNLKIPIHHRLKNIGKDDTVTVYLSKTAPLYYSNGEYIANEIYGISALKEE